MSKKIVRPRKVKIKDTDYKLASQDDLHCFIKRKVRNQKASIKKRQKLYGQIDYNKQLIQLEALQPTKEMVDTIIHEIFHGIIKEYEIPLDGRKEERFVRDLATGITDVLQNNPKLTAWIKKRLENTEN